MYCYNLPCQTLGQSHARRSTEPRAAQVQIEPNEATDARPGEYSFWATDQADFSSLGWCNCCCWLCGRKKHNLWVGINNSWHIVQIFTSFVFWPSSVFYIQHAHLRMDNTIHRGEALINWWCSEKLITGRNFHLFTWGAGGRTKESSCTQWEFRLAWEIITETTINLERVKMYNHQAHTLIFSENLFRSLNSSYCDEWVHYKL